MPLSSGDRLGPYEILAPIGAGGMGEVYRARDTRLGRDVALKLLPDPANRERFEQEARAVAALNHPNIMAVFDVGDDYFVGELIDGKSLRRLDPMPLRRVIEVAAQIADGLAAAHAAGIVHRDLKPENIMLTGDGRVKILDFGLARILEAAPQDPDATETIRKTNPGTVVGTAGYMSPEQVRGRAVDHRSDIFNFGLVLYEMIAGKRAFDHPTAVETMSAIMKEDPPDLPPTVPPAVQQIVRRCLEKERERRFQSAADLGFALRSLSSVDSSSNGSVPRIRKLRTGWIPYAIAATGIAIGVAIALFRSEPAPEPYKLTPLTSFVGIEMEPSLSPDATQVAFTWEGGPPDERGVYVQLIGGAQPLRISPAGRVARHPTWSPDGKRIAYLRAEGREAILIQIAALGGTERRIAHFPAPNADAIAWSPDGKQIVVRVDRALEAISIDTGERKKLTNPPGLQSDFNPRFSPDGETLAFLRSTSLFNNSVYWMKMPDGDPHRVGDRTWFAYSLDWLGDGKSLVLPVTEDASFKYWRVSLNGKASRLPLEFPFDGTTTSQGMVSVRGTRMVAAVPEQQSEVSRLSWNAGSKQWQPAAFYGSSRSDLSPKIAPNGKWIAFMSTRSGNFEIWRAALDGSEALQLTNAVRAGSPRWSPDSQWVTFDAPHGEAFGIYVVSAEGGASRYLTDGARPSYSLDGSWIYFSSAGNVWKIPAQGGVLKQLTHTTGAMEPFESADGTALYFGKGTGPDSITGGIFRVSPDGGEGQIVLNDPKAKAWAITPGAMYIGFNDRVERIDRESGKQEIVHRFPARSNPFDGGTSLAVSADERVMYLSGRKRTESDILLVDHFK